MGLKRIQIKKFKKDDKCICVVKGTKTNMFVNLLSKKKHLYKEFSGGNLGMEGAKKRTSYASESLGKRVGKEGLMLNFRFVEVVVKGGLDKRVKSVIRGIGLSGLKVSLISVLENKAHNGVRLRKPRFK